MSSRPSAAREASLRGDRITAPSQNAAACETPSNTTSSPSSPDSKRSNAAQLARELGSSSPWSETLMPQSYGTISFSPTSADRQETGDINQSTSHIEQDIDPPPVYTRNPQISDLHPVYELPAEAMDTPVMDNTVEPRSMPPTDDEQNQVIQPANPDVETPLLAGPRTRQEHRGCFRHTRKGSMSKRRRCCIVFTVTISSIIVSLLICIILAFKGFGDVWRNYPRCPKSTQPVVDTGLEYERHETTGDINGAYKLYDAMWLTTSTGTIDIEIDPQPADHPAVLILSTGIGSITLRLSPEYRCQRHKVQRTIYTHIKSLTGSVAAEILLGQGGYARVDTAAGLQNLSVLTYGVGPEDEASNLTTQSNSGTQRVVLTTLDPSYKSVSNVRGFHHSFGTSSLDIVYPSAWVGKVHAAASLPGLVSVSGDDLRYTHQYGDDITAYRGDGGNLTLVEVISEGTGSASFECQ